VWAPADEVGSRVERSVQQCPLIRAARANDRRAAQRDDLDVDVVDHASADLGQGLDAPQSVFGGGVGVRAHGSKAVPGHHACRPLGSLDRLVDVDEMPGRPHCRDGADQIAGLVVDPFGQEGLVEMGMRLDGCGQDDPPGEIDYL